MNENVTNLESFETLLDDTPVEAAESNDTTVNLSERIDVDELLDTPEQQETNEQATEEQQDETPDFSDNALYSFLQGKGIVNPDKMKFEGEDGEIEERSFNDLSIDEQKEVLNSLTTNDYTDYEQSVIQYLRDNETTLDQVIDFFANKKLNEYKEQMAQETPRQYSIDEYSDDDLYLANLKELHPSFTDEELVSKLEASKTNEALFAKEVEELRQQYKELEDKSIEEANLREQQQYQDLQNDLQQAAAKLTEIVIDPEDPESDSVVIEDSERQKALAYLFEQDTDGKSQLVKDLENPDALIELAWLRTQGAELLAGTSRYWKEELKQARAENKRLQAQLDKITKRNESSVVVPEKPSKTTNQRSIGSAWDRSGLL